MTKQFDVIYHDEVQVMDFGESRTAGAWVKLRLPDPDHLAVFRGMDTATAKRTGHILNMTLAQGDIIAADDEPEPESDYGKHAQMLMRQGFFRNPKVWQAAGTDAEFLAWLRDQQCASCKAFPPSEAAHVRRVANGAGVGIKPEFSAIPLCHDCHERQHRSGECAIGGREVVDHWRISYLEAWSREAIKKQLHSDSWRDISPSEFVAWCERHELHPPSKSREG